jgi:hypothetical protein
VGWAIQHPNCTRTLESNQRGAFTTQALDAVRVVRGAVVEQLEGYLLVRFEIARAPDVTLTPTRKHIEQPIASPVLSCRVI